MIVIEKNEKLLKICMLNIYICLDFTMSNPTLDISSIVPFAHLCKCFELMSTANNTKIRKRYLKTFVDAYTKRTRNFYPVLRLMAPESDLKRVFGIKERTLATIILDVYGISTTSSDGKRLLNWREGGGNLPSIIYSLVLARSTAKSIWTLKNVNQFLDELEKSKGVSEKKLIFRQVVSKLPACELKWLCKIILKKLRYGTSLTVLLDAFCPHSSDLFTFRADLEHVCMEIQDPNFRLEENMDLELFVPFQPMLSARQKPLDIPKSMSPPYFVETKYDGERILIHIQKRKTRVFSRYLQNSTTLYGKIIREIRQALDKSVKSCILDGELLVWDEERGCIEPFGGARCISTNGNKEEKKHFFLKIFDILHLNGNSLLQHALYERKELLYKSIKEIPTRVETVKHIECLTIEEVVSIFRKATQEKEEGVVVKNPRSPYMPNVRSKDAWVKLKPDFVSNIASDLDVIILGGYYGGGKKSGGKLYSYLVGVRNNDGTEYYPVGKVATGLSERDRDYLLEELEEDWICDIPENVQPGIDSPDVWIDPEDSRVLEVRAMQIIPCEKRPSGVTFRCPRIEKIRYDKEPEGIITLERLQSLIRETAILQENGMKSTTKKSRKKVYKPLTTPTDVKDVKVKSDLFKDQVFYVCGNAWKKEKRKKLESLIYAHGGTFYQNFSSKVTYVVSDTLNAQLKGIIDESKHRQQMLMNDCDYKNMRVVDLKELLKKRLLKVSGRKAELIERLEKNDKTFHLIHVVKPKWMKDCIREQRFVEFNEENTWN